MTTTQLLKTIKPPKGCTWNSATHAHFEAMKKLLAPGGFYMDKNSGTVIQLTSVGWKVL